MKPYVSPELLAYLKEQFPDRCAVPGSTVEAIWREAGAARVVSHLALLFEDQVAESLKA